MNASLDMKESLLINRQALDLNRRLGIVVKLRDMYWQELLGAALQESDSKHATLDLPSPSSYRHKGILGIDRWP